MASENQTPLAAAPLSKSGRGAFVALVLIAIVVAIVTGSVPVGVAFLAVGGLILGAVLLALSRRSV